MSAATIASLPEEILLTIFEYLDSPPPSILKSRLEPTLDLTNSSNHTLYKSLSQVSHSWRRIILPLLFRYSRLRLDTPPRKEWSQCPACGDNAPQSSTTFPVDETHKDLFTSALSTTTINSNDEPSRSPAFTLATLHWASRIHHSLADYITFLQNNNLAGAIHSFTILTNRVIANSDSRRFPHLTAATSDHRYRASAVLWQRLFETVPTLQRVVIVAPPSDLACLTNCAIDMFGDWAFEDMEFHTLELGVYSSSTTTADLNAREPIQGHGHPSTSGDANSIPTTSTSYVPTSYPGIAASSILRIRPWTHLALNEGSFLRAYGTYEYFERGPPSLIYSIKDCLSSPHHRGTSLDTLRKFTYTAILPFANHCNLRDLLPYLNELDIKLAPDPTSNILQDKDRVGKAQMEDCWSEFFDAYRAITRPFRTFEIHADGTPRLQRFVCRDVSTPGLVLELDEEFVPLCLPVWAEMEPGVFVRQEMCPPAYGAEVM